MAPHPIDSQEWRKWTTWEQYPLRHGVSLDQMRSSPREAALELLRASLSVRGFDTARHVMKRNELLGEITGHREFLGEWRYVLCIFGTPSTDVLWGWQMDGHHRNLSSFVLKDQVVMTPAFWGAEAATADRGPSAGLCACDAEQRNGLELIRALSLPQQKQAIICKSIIATDLPPERDTPPNGC